ncbi:MAG: hypothetical protein ACODAD_05340 [Planctomycetota bacterium]
MQIEYPLYLIPLETGYVSVVESSSGVDSDVDSDVDSEVGETCTYYLAVFTEQERAEGFMQAHGLEGSPRLLRNGRETAWMAESLREPVNNLAFDPSSESAGSNSKNVDARWKVTVADFLENHVVVDYSPWNYPVFVIEQSKGFVSVEGRAGNGEEMRAVGLFTTREKAERFLCGAEETGTARALETMHQAREFLQRMLPDVTAVALDLTADGGRRAAEYCFSIRTILDKYLVEQ